MENKNEALGTLEKTVFPGDFMSPILASPHIEKSMKIINDGI